MTTLIAKNDRIETSLTTESALSHYGIPVLSVVVDKTENHYGPADFIPEIGVTAESYIATMTEMFGEIEGADLFLSQLAK